ncbi:MAG TPA: molybdopterin-dependent oxidoreductase [Nitrososphaerales archaeon]|nr:molybdopterin-dependent oxidoreductase [Nitrososphaerales archaeon]
MKVSGFTLALAAGTVAVGCSYLFRVFLGVTYLPEVAAQALFSLAPGSVESQAVENLGALAKESAFIGASVVNVLLLALIPYALRRLGYQPEGRGYRMAFYSLVPYALLLALGFALLAIAQVASVPPTPIAMVLAILPTGIIFGLIAGYPRPAGALAARASQDAYCVPRSSGERQSDRKRRLFIKTAVASAVAAVVLYYGVGLLFPKAQPRSVAGEGASILSSRITPNDKFYRVDVNVLAPAVDSSSWSLNLHGLVNSPMKMSYAQLMSLPYVEEYATLECVSNNVGGDLASTALWKGVRLKEILDPAGVSAQADYIVFRCYDGYDVGVPMDRSLMDSAILAYEMNGAMLPNDHGFPVRAIIPGLYGMMNAKWVTEIEVVGQTYLGFWQRKGWTNSALYQTGSTILSPGDSPLRDRFPIPSSVTDVVGSSVPIVGVAFAGDRGISKVEVSTDGGNSWNMASLQDPLSGDTWILWNLDWNPPAAGAYRLMVRATDKTGQTQTATIRNPFPDGATGYQAVDIRVSTS